MLWAAWDARLSEPDASGVSTRAHLQARARQGDAFSIRTLAPPCEFPETLAYLWDDRFQVLDRMRGEGMNGRLAFTPESIGAANVLFGWHLTPHEAMALHRLDVAIRHPASVLDDRSDESVAATGTPSAPVPTRAWPTKKPQPTDEAS